MNNVGKALLGWILICLVIMFNNFWAGVGTFIIGIGICLIATPMIDWLVSEGDNHHE